MDFAQSLSHIARLPDEDLNTVVDELFSPGNTHIEVKCWECGHTVVRKPGQVPAGISQHELERRSVCKCGTGGPQVFRFPRKLPIAMR